MPSQDDFRRGFGCTACCFGCLTDYRSHPCLRNCSDQSNQPMLCEYDFNLETYSTFSRACFHCPRNSSDCLREQCISADGFKRTIQVVNRLFPGPSIQVCKDDTIVVNVENRLRSGEISSIHWHGLRQKFTNYMDGPSMITQCPILPHNKFQYT